jgi:hypothetical protein
MPILSREVDAELAKVLSDGDPSLEQTVARHALTIMRLRAALKEIADMKPSELAPETFPGLVHGPALLLDNCRRLARKALKQK